jgi:PPOX class probable F420-dependent enzyme
MPIPLPDSARKVLEDKAYGHVVTFNPNGRPQVTMVWMDVEGNEALFNTAEGRKKPQNLQRDPRVIISVQNRSEPQSYLVLNGTATVTEKGPTPTPTSLRNDSSGWTSTRTVNLVRSA